jgi:transcription elongation factor Elf1
MPQCEAVKDDVLTFRCPQPARYTAALTCATCDRTDIGRLCIDHGAHARRGATCVCCGATMSVRITDATSMPPASGTA